MIKIRNFSLVNAIKHALLLIHTTWKKRLSCKDSNILLINAYKNVLLVTTLILRQMNAWNAIQIVKHATVNILQVA